ncbi:MAG: ThuA domain-containing protein [Planctomycetota bacterium]|jgi:type 1 glutamine amidotransferase/HEAT repeat protein
MAITIRSALAAVVLVLAGAVTATCARAAEDAAKVDKAFEDLRVYDHDKPRAPLTLIESYIARSTRDAAAARRAAVRLAEVIAAPDTSAAAKEFACMQLLVVGADEQVPILKGMLGDPATAETARRTLEGIPGEASLGALRGALARLEGRTLVGAVNSLGIRGDGGAVAGIARLLTSPDVTVAGAAVAALGKIATPEAAKALAGARVTGKLEAAVRDARLGCARRLATAGDTDSAAAIYRGIWETEGPVSWRIAGLAGLAELAEADGGGKLRILPVLLEGMVSADPEIQAAALGLVRELPGAEATEALVRELPKLDAGRQAVVLRILAERGDRSAAGAVARLTGAANEGVRTAALAALGALGDASHVEALARAAASGAARRAAREALARLSAPGVDARLVQIAAKGGAQTRAEAMRAIAARRTEGAGGVLMEAATDPEGYVRRAAFGALAATAGAEAYPDLVELLAGTRTTADARAAEKAVATAGGRLGAPAVAPVVAALRGATESSQRSLLRVLGRLGGPEALAAVREHLRHESAAVRDEAVRVMSSWPDASVADELLDLARDSGSALHRALAIRGCLRLAREVASAPGGEARALAILERARPLANSGPDRRMLLACLASVPDAKALRSALAFLDDAEVRAEAAAAALTLGRELVRRDRDAVRAAMDELLAKVENEAVLERARALRAEAEKPAKPLTAREALAHDAERSLLTRKRLARRAPAGFRLACYLDCGPDRADGGKGAPGLRLVTGAGWFWPGADAKDDVRFGTVAYDGGGVAIEASDLDPEREYRLGFSWWDYDQGGRVQSVSAEPLGRSRGKRARELLGATPLPSGKKGERPAERTLALPRELTAGGGVRVAFRGHGGPNVVVSEVWLWEGDAKSAGPAQKARPQRKPTTRVVVVTGVDYPGHKWRQTAPVLRDGLEEDPRLGVEVVEDPGFLASPRLRDFDVIVIHFMDWKVPAPGADARANLKRLVEGGKGLVLVHFACGAFQDWPEFRDLAGRVWDPKLRGHDRRGRFRVEIAAPEHPVTRGLEAFEADDELYTCTVGEKAIEVLATARSKVDRKVYPMAFVHAAGKGRVFHCLLGHDVRAFEAGSVLELFRRGTAWAAGVAPVPPE